MTLTSSVVYTFSLSLLTLSQLYQVHNIHGRVRQRLNSGVYILPFFVWAEPEMSQEQTRPSGVPLPDNLICLCPEHAGFFQTAHLCSAWASMWRLAIKRTKSWLNLQLSCSAEEVLVFSVQPFIQQSFPVKEKAYPWACLCAMCLCCNTIPSVWQSLHSVITLWGGVLFFYFCGSQGAI